MARFAVLVPILTLFDSVLPAQPPLVIQSKTHLFVPACRCDLSEGSTNR